MDYRKIADVNNKIADSTKQEKEARRKAVQDAIKKHRENLKKVEDETHAAPAAKT